MASRSWETQLGTERINVLLKHNYWTGTLKVYINQKLVFTRRVYFMVARSEVYDFDYKGRKFNIWAHYNGLGYAFDMGLDGVSLTTGKELASRKEGILIFGPFKTVEEANTALKSYTYLFVGYGVLMTMVAGLLHRWEVLPDVLVIVVLAVLIFKFKKVWLCYLMLGDAWISLIIRFASVVKNGSFAAGIFTNIFFIFLAGSMLRTIRVITTGKQ